MKAIHIHDEHNLGDSMCVPTDYCPQFGPAEKVNVRSITAIIDDKTPMPPLGDAIIGGGGMLYPSLPPVLGALLAQKRDTRLVIWGIGSNTHDATTADYPKLLAAYDLVGIRDYGNPYQYVPCPSCMNPEFDLPAVEPTHDFVIYEHYEHPIELEVKVPRCSNDRLKTTFSHVLSFLAEGRVVLTNTFHGAYWALLLNRPVVVYKPFSSRFYGFKPAVLFADDKTWQEQLGKAAAPGAEYLHECRALNAGFARQVAKLFG